MALHTVSHTTCRTCTDTVDYAVRNLFEPSASRSTRISRRAPMKDPTSAGGFVTWGKIISWRVSSICGPHSCGFRSDQPSARRARMAGGWADRPVCDQPTFAMRIRARAAGRLRQASAVCATIVAVVAQGQRAACSGHVRRLQSCALVVCSARSLGRALEPQPPLRILPPALGLRG
jgi:hypothetical protein